MKKIIILFTLFFSSIAFSSELLEGKSFCFTAEGSRADVMKYSFMKEGEGMIRGYAGSNSETPLFSDPIQWDLNEKKVIRIDFSSDYYYRTLHAQLLFEGQNVVFDWLDVAHAPTKMKLCGVR